MRNHVTERPVIVGIDGSKAAVRAAIWAAEEATGDDTPLRLTHVVGPKKRMNREYNKAYRRVHRAWAAVEATGLPVKLECDFLEGDPVESLVTASRHAEMVCVGWKGRHDSGDRQRGYTAVELARTAFAPVAVVRSHSASRVSRPVREIVALLDDSSESHMVLETAVGEALRRDASVLALTPWSIERHDLDGARQESVRAQLKQLLDENDQESTDICIRAARVPDDLVAMLAQGDESDRLVVLSKSRPELLDELSNSRARSLLRKTNCSLLVLHDRQQD